MRRSLAPTIPTLMLTAMIAATIATGPAAAAVPAPISISQKFRAFHPGHVTIEAGQTIHFLNDDAFVHQLYVHAPDFDFESQEQPPGSTIAITFKHPGTYQVRCHIHPLMRLIVVVTARRKP